MDGWSWEGISKDEATSNVSIVVSNYLMARTRQIERWDDRLYERARRWSLWAQMVRSFLLLSLSTLSCTLSLLNDGII